ncbi:MAG: 4Fe-4S dicluster domain-containing protein [Proteobacteria bacterium]|nr:4Fe-4S dicluster domain-containing protein [Pseudomonadota bacterium]
MPFARLQQALFERMDSDPRLKAVLRRGDRGPTKREPVAPVVVENTAQAWSAKVKEFARAHEADLVGIVRLDPLWVYDRYEATEPWLIVLGVAMDYDHLSTAPAIAAGIEVMEKYNRGTRAARKLANWIHAQGYHADAHGGPLAGPVSLVPAALAAGFGELGKHGSIINRELGSSFRLAAVRTDMPLVVDQPDMFGADDFCTSCQLCTNACPPQAIFEDKQVVRGDQKWYVDFDKCIGYFHETYGCAICIAVCPWSRPGVAKNLAQKMTRRAIRRNSGLMETSETAG